MGNTGKIYEADYSDIYIFPPSGSPTDVTITPAITQPSIMTIDSGGNLFLGGYIINELTPGGTQTEVNTVGGSGGLFTDAAETLYARRYSTGGVAELPASGYGAAEASVDTSASPPGASMGPDGTVFVENYTNLDIVNRAQGGDYVWTADSWDRSDAADDHAVQRRQRDAERFRPRAERLFEFLHRNARLRKLHLDDNPGAGRVARFSPDSRPRIRGTSPAR